MWHVIGPWIDMKSLLKKRSPAQRVRAEYQTELNAKSVKKRVNSFERSIKVKKL